MTASEKSLFIWLEETTQYASADMPSIAKLYVPMPDTPPKKLTTVPTSEKSKNLASDKNSVKTHRLAEKLRENLRKRKQQQRSRLTQRVEKSV